MCLYRHWYNRFTQTVELTSATISGREYGSRRTSDNEMRRKGLGCDVTTQAGSPLVARDRGHEAQPCPCHRTLLTAANPMAPTVIYMPCEEGESRERRCCWAQRWIEIRLR